MTRREWLLIAHTMRDEMYELEQNKARIASSLDCEAWNEAQTLYFHQRNMLKTAARSLADAIHKYESEPSDRWLRRHPGEPPENYRTAFDKARFLQECGL